MLALTNGVLIKQADGCVGLKNSSGRKPVLLRWPAGTTLATDESAVIGLSGAKFPFDSEIGFGGGYGGMPVPGECSSQLWGGVFEVQQPL